jgi:hypothetical protein
MKRFPAEFEDLLSAAGRRVLAGRSALCGALARPGCRFLARTGLLDRRRALAAAALVDRALHEAMRPLERPIPPEAISGMTENYGELLPKTVRAKTAYLERRRELAYRRAEEVGLLALMRSASFGAFATALAGRPLRRRWGEQVLCYGPGDYAGPHNDHHPELPEARQGYIDVHVTLCLPGVARQWLVYAEDGHLDRIANVATVGGVTAYRLPIWHYTTPLEARRGASARTARRWVLLGTFLYAASGPAA